jgi:NitT/TauT family transport system substrate-binding protein
MASMVILRRFSPFALFPVVVSLLMLSACSAPQAVPSSSALQKIKVGLNPYISYSPLFIAQDEGYFTEQGLSVEFVNFTTGSDASSIPMLEQRQLDVAGQGPVTGLFNAIARSNDIKIVVDRGYLAVDGCTYIAVLAKTEWVSQNPTLTLNNIKGKRISLDPKNFSAYIFEKAITPAGVALGDLVTGDIPPANLMAAVTNGGVDFISTGEPWITRLTDTKKMVVWQAYQKVMPEMQYGFEIIGPSLLVDHPDLGKKFVTAYVKAIRQYNQGKTDRNVAIIAKYTQLDPDLLKRACWPAMRNSGEVNVDTLLKFQSWALQKGLIDKAVTAEQLWDPEFVNAANQTLGTAP